MTDATDGGVIGAGRVAVVTGAASGIGRALAERFAAEGSAVVVADLDASEAEVVAAGIRAAGGEAEAVAVDVSDAAAVDRLAATTLERFGRVDVLCNNAGVSTFNLFRDQTLDDWRWVVGVNFWGVVHGLQTFVPIMREQGTPGHIVNTASIAGLVSGVAFIGPYCATKVAVVSISETLAQELAIEESPIGVSVLCPSSVDTKVMESERGRPAGAGGRTPHRDGGVGAAHDPRRVHRADRSDPRAGGRRACSTRSATASSGSSPTDDLAPTVETRFDGILAGFPAEGRLTVAWDFETDPEFEEQLEWMRAFIDTELIPLEPILQRAPARRVGAGQGATCRSR